MFRCRWDRSGVTVYQGSLVSAVRQTSTNVSLHLVQLVARALISSTPSGASASRVIPEVGVQARWTAAYRRRAGTAPRVTRCRSPPEVSCAHALPDIRASCVKRKWMNVFPVRVVMAERVLMLSLDITADVRQDIQVHTFLLFVTFITFCPVS